MMNASEHPITDAELLQHAVRFIAEDFEKVLRHHARAGVTGRILRHAATQLLGSLMLAALDEGPAARAECRDLLHALSTLIAPAGDRAC